MARRKSKPKSKVVNTVTYVQTTPAPAQPRRRRRTRAARGGMSGADDGGRAYARLLADPCHAPLVHPPYLGGATGYLTRFESDFTVFDNDATTTGGVCVFAPGLFCSSTSAPLSAWNDSTTISGSGPTQDPNAATTLHNAYLNQPGFNFLGSQAQTVRPVAACLEVYYPGSELTRQGFVSVGNVSAGALNELIVGTTRPSYVRTLVETTVRCPENMLSINWLPYPGDELATETDLPNASGDVAKRGAIFLAASGLSPGVGLRVRLVAVYEWTPGLQLGMPTLTNDGPPPSKMRLEEIIAGLKRANAFVGSVMAMGNSLRDLYGRTRPRALM